MRSPMRAIFACVGCAQRPSMACCLHACMRTSMLTRQQAGSRGQDDRAPPREGPHAVLQSTALSPCLCMAGVRPEAAGHCLCPCVEQCTSSKVRTAHGHHVCCVKCRMLWLWRLEVCVFICCRAAGINERWGALRALCAQLALLG
jgi:hypothetical protein